MGDTFYRILLAVREIVGGIDHPGVARLVMRHLADTVEDRITQVDIGCAHIDSCAQHLRACIELPGAHAGEQVEILLDTALPIRAVPAWLGECPAVLPRLIGVEIAHVGIPVLNEVYRPVIQLLEVA